MPAINFADAVMLGSTPADKVMLGSSQVWSSAPAAQTYADLVLAESPLAYYRLGDALHSTVCADSSGNDRHAEYRGLVDAVLLEEPGMVAGDSDTCAKFTKGSSGWVGHDSAAWMNVNEFTFEGIAHFTTWDSGNGDPIMSRYTAGDNYPFVFGRKYGNPYVWAQVVIGGTRYNPTGTTYWNTGETRHVAVTYDGATVRVFLAGVEEGSVAASGTVGWSTSELNIARYSASNSTIPSGWLDEVFFCDHAADPAGIAERAAMVAAA